MLAALFDRRPAQVSLGFLSSRDPDLEQLEDAAHAARYATLVRTLERSLLVRIDGEWSDYERSLSANLRRDLGRCRRRLEELGRVELEVGDDATKLREALALEQLGWKSQAGTAVLSSPKTEMFYTDVASWAAERGWLRLIFLRLGGRAVAFHLALEHDATYLPLKGGFDPAFGHLSPGKLIIHATLERAFAEGLSRYEFLGHTAEYKRRWANDTYSRLLFQAFAPSLRGRVRHAAFASGRPLVRRALAARPWLRAGPSRLSG